MMLILSEASGFKVTHAVDHRTRNYTENNRNFLEKIIILISYY
jgi:hypothetical protein